MVPVFLSTHLSTCLTFTVAASTHLLNHGAGVLEHPFEHMLDIHRPGVNRKPHSLPHKPVHLRGGHEQQLLLLAELAHAQCRLHELVATHLWCEREQCARIARQPLVCPPVASDHQPQRALFTTKGLDQKQVTASLRPLASASALWQTQS